MLKPFEAAECVFSAQEISLNLFLLSALFQACRRSWRYQAHEGWEHSPEGNGKFSSVWNSRSCHSFSFCWQTNWCDTVGQSYFYFFRSVFDVVHSAHFRVLMEVVSLSLLGVF